MIKVTRDEVDTIRKTMPDVHIAIVNKHTSHKKYYAEETQGVMRIVAEARGLPMPKRKRW